MIGKYAIPSAAWVVKAQIKNGKIEITSESAGTATITVMDASNFAAEIAVTVSPTGAITIDAITKTPFTSVTNSATANDDATLGFVGTTAESSSIGVATVEIKDGKIKINSISPGTATITVNTTPEATTAATIAVTVNPDGSIKINSINKGTPQ